MRQYTNTIHEHPNQQFKTCIQMEHHAFGKLTFNPIKIMFKQNTKHYCLLLLILMIKLLLYY